MKDKPFFSVCIPNYNYASYIGETIQSVLDQGHIQLEIVISDNSSTDASLDIIKSYASNHDNIRYRVNRCNVGFYENLKKTASLAVGEWMTMLSSDDLAAPDAYAVYKIIIDALGASARRSVLCSAADRIDEQSNKIEPATYKSDLFAGAKLSVELTKIVGADVYEISAAELLRSSLKRMRNPLHFATTTYSRDLHDSVEGYSWGGVFNPDASFVWNILSVAERVYFVDKPLFKYRVHSSNQTAQQQKSKALKYWIDQYMHTYQLADRVLHVAGLNRQELAENFIQHDVCLRALLSLSHNDRETARRIHNLGKAAYPNILNRNLNSYLLGALIVLGPLGVFIARFSKKIFLRKQPKLQEHGY